MIEYAVVVFSIFRSIVLNLFAQVYNRQNRQWMLLVTIMIITLSLNEEKKPMVQNLFIYIRRLASAVQLSSKCLKIDGKVTFFTVIQSSS